MHNLGAGKMNVCTASWPDPRELKFLSRIRDETDRERLDLLWDQNKQKHPGLSSQAWSNLILWEGGREC